MARILACSFAAKWRKERVNKVNQAVAELWGDSLVRMEFPFGVSFVPISARQISSHICMRPFVQMPLGKQKTLDFCPEASHRR